MNQPYFEPPHPFIEFPPAAIHTSADGQISADYFLKLGNRHYNQYLSRGLKRDLETAVDHYRHALEMDPTLPETYVKLASALWDKGVLPLEAAIDYCESGLQLDSNYAEGHLFLGYFLRRAGRLQDAENHFRQAIAKSSPSNGISPAKAHLALGRVMIEKAVLSLSAQPLGRLGLLAGGLQQFAAGCCLLPSDKNAFQTLQNALLTDMQIFSVTGAGRVLKNLGLRQPTVNLYEWASKKLPHEPVFFHLLGDIHAEKEGADGAIYFYNRCLELDPDNVLVHKKLGRLYHRCHDPANAARSLEKVVDAEAQDFDTLYLLAQIHMDNGEHMRALYYFKDLLSDSPENPYLHSNMAYVLFKLEDYDGAILAYQHAVNYGTDPVWTATVAQTLGTIHYQIKRDLEAAINLFQLAYQLDPGNLDCLTMLGDIYTEQGLFEEAIQAYRHILRVEPDNADCYNYLGYLLWQMDKNDDAVAAYQRAIELNSHNAIAYNNLGVIFLDEKCQPEQALQMFETALQLKTDYTLACFNVARTKEALGHTTEAARGYADALQLNQENPELSPEEIQERLENLFQV